MTLLSHNYKLKVEIIRFQRRNSIPSHNYDIKSQNYDIKPRNDDLLNRNFYFYFVTGNKKVEIVTFMS